MNLYHLLSLLMCILQVRVIDGNIIRKGRFLVKHDKQITNVTETKLFTTSKTKCVVFCQRTNCAGVSYHNITNECRLVESYNCFYTVAISTGWTIFIPIMTNNTYVAESKSWIDAGNHCMSLGGRLASVRSSYEHIYMISLLPGVVWVWIGGYYNTSEGVWKWTDTEEMVHQEYWGVGKPDNHGGNQNCMVYRDFPGYFWDDRECFLPYSFLCEF